MRSRDERCTRRERCDETGRDEEVRVDDIRLEAAGAHERLPGEREVTSLSTRTSVEHGMLHVMSTYG